MRKSTKIDGKQREQMIKFSLTINFRLDNDIYNF